MFSDNIIKAIRLQKTKRKKSKKSKTCWKVMRFE